MKNLIDKDLIKLLSSGGDLRLCNGHADDMSTYNTRFQPYDHLRYGNCTASTIHHDAFSDLRNYLNEIENSENIESSNYELYQSSRDKIRNLLDLDDDTDIIFSPSGTDLEYIPFIFSNNNRVKNIVFDIEEIGAGIQMAANGQYFSDTLPFSKDFSSGEKIYDKNELDIDVEVFKLRILLVTRLKKKNILRNQSNQLKML